MTFERWSQLLQKLGLANAPDVFSALDRAYAEKHRHYHTHTHIDAMLTHLDKSRTLATNEAELELAIWFHDAIYKPFSSSNEIDSANWARHFLLHQGYDPQGAERVHQLVMATAHQSRPNSPDEQLISDIDLTILGTPENVYDDFELNVRREYRWVPSMIYRRKRRQLLESFLHREAIYHTEYFRTHYETAARTNLLRTISHL